MTNLVLASFFVVSAWATDPTWQVAASTSGLVGSENVFLYKPSVALGQKLAPDVLSSGTTHFAVLKAEARADGTWAWSVIPLAEGIQRFTARWNLDGAPVSAPAITLAIITPPIDKDADIEDIKGPLAARRALWPWLLAAVIGAIVWEGWRRWKAWRSRRPAEIVAPMPSIPPEIAAETALTELQASGLWSSGQHNLYYLRLTEILRLYLEARWGEAATAMTTPEIARLIKDRHADIRLAAQSRELLQRADLVKFARIKPAPSDGDDDAQLVRSIVHATTPHELVAPDSAR